MPAENWIAIGDSFMVSPDTVVCYPVILQSKLTNVTIDNQGLSGYGSALLLGVANGYSAGANPTTAIICCGTNDFNAPNIGTVQASPAPTTTTFTVDAGKGARFVVGAAVIVGSQPSRIISGISTDAITLSSALPIAPTAADSVTADTVTNTVAIGVKLVSLGYTKLYVGVHQYNNWTTGGDTTSATTAGLYATLRGYQRSSAAALGAVTFDIWWYMRKRIIDGIDVQGSFSTSIADGNAHPNAYGAAVMADILAGYIHRVYSAI